MQFHNILTWKAVVGGFISVTVFSAKVCDVCCLVLFSDFNSVLQILIVWESEKLTFTSQPLMIQKMTQLS